MINKENIIERLAELEHNQWIMWSKAIVKEENLSPERIERWKKLWIPYDFLSENQKEQDRQWAKISYSIFEEEMNW